MHMWNIHDLRRCPPRYDGPFEHREYVNAGPNAIEWHNEARLDRRTVAPRIYAFEGGLEEVRWGDGPDRSVERVSITCQEHCCICKKVPAPRAAPGPQMSITVLKAQRRESATPDQREAEAVQPHFRRVVFVSTLHRGRNASDLDQQTWALRACGLDLAHGAYSCVSGLIWLF